MNLKSTVRFSAIAAIAALALSVSAQVNQPNTPPSGSASQNSSPATDATTGRNGNSLDSTNAAPLSAETQKDMDKAFVRKMVMGNHSEIDAGNIALQKSGNDDVKKFAQKMVDDHTALLNDMTQLAGQLNVKASQSASSKDKAMAAKLSSLSGDAFDKAYVSDMVKDHKNDVAEISKEANSAAIPQVKDAANKALPIIEGHLEMIQDIQKKMKSSSAKGTK